MKVRHIVIIACAILLLGLLYIPILSSGAEEKSKVKQSSIEFVPVLEAFNVERSQTLSSYGQVTPNVQMDVMFEVQGKLKKGDLRLRPGTKFRKGQVLYEVDNKEAILLLQSRKIAFKNLTNQILADIDLDYNSELAKWSSFYTGISASKFLPKLPSFSSAKEERFVNSRGLLAEYYGIRSTEERLLKYYYTAPFSGTVVATYTEPGALASPGMRIATIVKTGDFEVKIPVTVEDVDQYNSAGEVVFMNEKSEEIGKGKLSRISDVINQRTQSVDAYFSIQPLSKVSLYSGMFVSIGVESSIIAKSVALPRMAVENNSVAIVSDSSVQEKKVQIIGRQSDSVFVTGIPNGAKVLTEKFLFKSDTIKVVGVVRK